MVNDGLQEILDYLDADVICMQETKITRAKLESDLALVPGYDSYWSFHRTKSGYSGVVIYIKDHIKLLAAEEGISGLLSGNMTITTTGPSADNSIDNGGRDTKTKRVGGYPPLRPEDDSTAILARYQELDTEGRGIILDFGIFVLFNLYCPNETDETRLPFKMDYYHLLETRVQELIKEGRQVIVVGDMNVVPTELDHCDPAKWKKETGEDDFGNTLPRRWFNSFLAPAGPLTDLYRVFHKDEPGAFTCWNTKINARPSNYGTRLDYILVTSGLLPWFKSCDRKPHVPGSDHCPVVAEMFTELTLEKSEQERTLDVQKAQKLQDLLDSYGGTTEHTLAAKYFDEFSGKQQKLSAFFKKPVSQAKAAGPTAGLPVLGQISPSPSLLLSGRDTKRSISEDSLGEEASRKKLFLSANTASTPPSSLLSSISTTTSSPALSTAVSAPTSQSSSRSSIPKPDITKQMSKTSTTTRLTPEKAGWKKSGGAKPAGQQSVLSFFSSSSRKAVADTPAPASTTVRESLQALAAPESQSSSLTDSQSSSILSSLPLSQPQPQSQDNSASIFSPNDFADWIPGSQDVLPFSMNGEATTSKWQSLFQPKAVPKCRFHGVPCTEYTVNKKGPNKGRRFFLCSLPVGPEGDAIGQKPEYRCNYFEWLNPERKKQ
ncbi:Class II abasic (AP) endonuclease [Mortierella claussenii]|nr:Class II abasic (AP) endonuclease [Mortierella claussenii]